MAKKKKKKEIRKPLDIYLSKYEFGGKMAGGIFDLASDALMGMTTASVSSLIETLGSKVPSPVDYIENTNPTFANGGNMQPVKLNNQGYKGIDILSQLFAKGGTMKGGPGDPPKNKLEVSSANDPRYKSYQDSTNLYNAYQMQQKIHGVGTPLSGNPGLWNTKALERRRTKSDVKEPSTAKEFLKNASPEAKELVNYYQSLGFNDSNIGYRDSPEVYSNTVKPTGSYQSKAGGYNPAYPKPYTQVSVNPNQKMQMHKTLESIPEGPPRETLHSYMKSKGLDATYKAREGTAKAYGIENYKGTEKQNIEMLNKLKTNYQAPSNDVPMLAYAAYDSMPTGVSHDEYQKATGGTINKSMFNFGGNILEQFLANGGMMQGMANAEVEGGEVYETPNGEVGEFEGPDHEQGGIPIQAPAGTEIFSKQLGKAGKSMAQRKLKREKEISKLEDAMEERPFDKILKDTHARMKERNAIEEDGDKRIQEATTAMEQAKGLNEYLAKYGKTIQPSMYANGGELSQFANGGPIYPNPPVNFIGGDFGSMPGSKSYADFAQDQVGDYLPENYTVEDMLKMPRFQGPDGVKKLQQSIIDLQKKVGPTGAIGNYDIGPADNIAGSKTEGFFSGGANESPDPSKAATRRLAFAHMLGGSGSSLGHIQSYDDVTTAQPGFYSDRNKERLFTDQQLDSSLPSAEMDITGGQQGLNIAESSSYKNPLDMRTTLESINAGRFDDKLQALKDYKPGDEEILYGVNKFFKDSKPNNLISKGGGLDFGNTPIGLGVGAQGDKVTADNEPISPEGISPEGLTTNQQGYDFTPGDLMGMLGTKISGLAPLATTLANRLGDTPEINAYKNYGLAGLDTIESQKGFVGQMRDKTLSDAKLQEAGASKVRRGSARSVNQLRGLDQLGNAQLQEGRANAYNVYAQQMMGIAGQKAAAQTQRDAAVMAGEQEKDTNTKKARDNFFTQLNQDFVNLGTSKQKMGKDLNTKKGDQDFLDLLSQISTHGFGMRRNATGQLEMYDTNTGTTATPKEVQAVTDQSKKELKKKKKKKVGDDEVQMNPSMTEYPANLDMDTITTDYGSLMGGNMFRGMSKVNN